jgi:hypothetical protein
MLYKNGSTDLNIYFFLLFALLQGWFKKKKNRKSCPENWKIREKLCFFVMDMHNYFFFVLFVIVVKKFSGKKSGQLQRKVEKFGQTAKIIIFVCILNHNITDDISLILFFLLFYPGMEITQLNVFNRKKNLQDLEKNLEKLN